jgi:hypothetical protein
VAASDNVNVADVLAEEHARAFAHAADFKRAALAEHDFVEVQLEDLVLRVAPVEDQRHELFLQLARRRLGRREERVLDDLLGDG